MQGWGGWRRLVPPQARLGKGEMLANRSMMCASQQHPAAWRVCWGGMGLARARTGACASCQASSAASGTHWRPQVAHPGGPAGALMLTAALELQIGRQRGRRRRASTKSPCRDGPPACAAPRHPFTEDSGRKRIRLHAGSPARHSASASKREQRAAITGGDAGWLDGLSSSKIKWNGRLQAGACIKDSWPH